MRGDEREETIQTHIQNDELFFDGTHVPTGWFPVSSSSLIEDPEIPGLGTNITPRTYRILWYFRLIFSSNFNSNHIIHYLLISSILLLLFLVLPFQL